RYSRCGSCTSEATVIAGGTASATVTAGSASAIAGGASTAAGPEGYIENATIPTAATPITDAAIGISDRPNSGLERSAEAAAGASTVGSSSRPAITRVTRS